MELDKNLVRELNKDLKRDKVLQFIKKYIKQIIMLVVVLVVVGTSYLGYSFYIQNKANKDSIVFADLKDALGKGDDKKALILMDKLIDSGTKGYVFLAYMEKANLYVSQNKSKEAVLVLQEAAKKIELPQYYKDMIRSVEFINRLNAGHDLAMLAKDVKATLNKDDAFYYSNLEVYASLLFVQKNYKDSTRYYQEIIDSDKVSPDLKDRAKRAKGLLASYIK